MFVGVVVLVVLVGLVVVVVVAGVEVLLILKTEELVVLLIVVIGWVVKTPNPVLFDAFALAEVEEVEGNGGNVLLLNDVNESVEKLGISPNPVVKLVGLIEKLFIAPFTVFVFVFVFVFVAAVVVVVDADVDVGVDITPVLTST